MAKRTKKAIPSWKIASNHKSKSKSARSNSKLKGKKAQTARGTPSVRETAPLKRRSDSNERSSMRENRKRQKMFSWADRMDQLAKYKEAHEDVKVPTKRRDPDYKLGLWLAAQRSLYRKKSLKKDRLADLRKLGCTGFGEDSPRCETPTSFQNDLDAEAEKASEGELHSASMDTNEEEEWDEISATPLRKDQPSMQEEIAEQTVASKKKNFSWADRMAQLAEYKETFGHLNVATKKRDPHYKLGAWLAAQKSLYRKNALRRDRLEDLRKLGWSTRLKKKTNGVQQQRSSLRRSSPCGR